LFEILKQIYVEVLRDEDQKYLRFVRDLAAARISRSLRVILTSASVRFFLRHIPAMQRHLRRNAGSVVSWIERNIVRITYSDFPDITEQFYQFSVWQIVRL